jgi:precorrin-3B synthase
MQSGDGLIVRIRPFCGALDLAQARGLAELAQRLGNGHIDLTRRANLQVRGLAEASLPELHGSLAALGLIDADVDSEAARNLMVSPLAGLDATVNDVRPMARRLAGMLTGDRRLHALPAKFGLLVDGGGAASIASERADIALMATDGGIAIGIDTPPGGQWLGVASAAAAPRVAIAAAHAFLDARGGQLRLRMRGLSAVGLAQVTTCLQPLLRHSKFVPPVADRRLGARGAIVGVAAPFGRLAAGELSDLVALAGDAGAVDLRLSPWRSLYFGVRNELAARSVAARASDLGLIVDANDPILRIAACPGAPDCASSSVDARRDARRLAALAAAQGFAGSIHVSGCAKGCARSEPSDLVLVGEAGRYRAARHATTREAGGPTVGPDGLPALLGRAHDG